MDALYVDLDGTLLGPGGSLVRGEGGAWSLDALHALEACHRAGTEVVLVSGRARRVLAEDARLLGLTSYIAELGSLVVLDGEAHALGARPAGDGTVFQQVEAAGAPALLLERFAGRLEPHAPWHRGRDVTHVFRGLVDRDEADAVLAAHGHDDLRLLDNGPSHTHGTLVALPRVRVYHLLNRAASKAAAVAWHREARGYDRSACVAVGDSPEDLTMAGEVGALWLVANAVRDDPELEARARSVPGVRVAHASFGSGVLEAVRHLQSQVSVLRGTGDPAAMRTIHDVQTWQGQDVIDRDGDKIGKLEDIYLDRETGEPEWAAVKTGLFGHKVSFVPIEGADKSADGIRVSYDKATVKDAPRVDADGRLSTEEEEQLYRHYGRSGYHAYTGPEDDYDREWGEREGRFDRDTSGPTTDDAMTRSEEELKVGTTPRETGRARLRKYVVTEHVETTVPVTREEVRIEREPITDANVDDALSGPDISEEEHEVVLHAEEPVVEKRTVPKERVRMETDTVSDEETVTGEVRKERIEAEGDLDDDLDDDLRRRR